MSCNFGRLGIFFCFLFLFGVLFGWFGFPKFLHSMLKKQINLKPGSDLRNTWTKLPIPITFNVWVFNVTNPDEVTQGAKPILNEVGPFVFEEWKDKYDLEDNEEEDSVTFKMRNTFLFQPEIGGLSGDTILTMPHPLTMLTPVMIKRERAAMIEVISNGLTIMFPSNSPFINVKFMDYFYNGIPVDCSSDEFAVKAICSQFSSDLIKGGFLVNETHFGYSILGSGNATNLGQFTVLRGIKDYRTIGQVIKFEEDDELSVWDEESSCNKYKGTDSTIFPALLSPKDGLWSFSGDLCRSLGAVFDSKGSYAGLPIIRYKMDLGDLKNEPENHCFCNAPPNDCPPKGTMQLQKCIGVPLVVSLPHFYKGDEDLLQNVKGLKPIPEKHEIEIEFEILTGTPMSAKKRLQFNFDIESVEQFEPMKNIRKMILPVFWVEEIVQLNKTFVDLLKNSVYLTIKVNNFIRWTFGTIGFLGFGLSIYFYRQQKKKIIIGPVNQVTSIDNNNNIENFGNNHENIIKNNKIMSNYINPLEEDDVRY